MSADAVVALSLMAPMVPFFIWFAWQMCLIGPSEEVRSIAYEKESMRQKIYKRIEEVELDSPEYWGLIEMLETAPSFYKLKPNQFKLLCPIPTRKGPNHTPAIAETTSDWF